MIPTSPPTIFKLHSVLSHPMPYSFPLLTLSHHVSLINSSLSSTATLSILSFNHYPIPTPPKTLSSTPPHNLTLQSLSHIIYYASNIAMFLALRYSEFNYPMTYSTPIISIKIIPHHSPLTTRTLTHSKSAGDNPYPPSTVDTFYPSINPSLFLPV